MGFKIRTQSFIGLTDCQVGPIVRKRYTHLNMDRLILTGALIFVQPDGL